MKSIKKKIYEALPSRVTKGYRIACKTIILHIVYPFTYKFFTLTKKSNKNKVVFIETRFDKITDSFQLVYKRMKKEGYEIHEEYLLSLQQGNWAYMSHCLRMLKDISDAHYIFLNDVCNITSCIPLRKESKIFQLWHACGAFKKFGMSTSDLIFGDSRKNQEKFPYYRNQTYVTVSSPEISWAYEEAMDLKGTDTQIVATGISRTDVFYDKDFIKKAKETVYSVCPQTRGKKIILYAPTFRGRVVKAEGPDQLNIQAMMDSLGDEYILLIKHHPFVKKRPDIPDECKDFALDISEKLEIDQLLCSSDICISDYSSLVFEYSLFERPMIFFAYDLDDYFDWRGFYYDYGELTPGPVVAEIEAIIDYIKNLDTRFDKAKVHAFREKFMSACDGHATDRIMDLVHNC